MGLTKAAAKETARHGVRVNAIQSGLITSPMTAAMPESVWDQKMSAIPMARAGEPEAVAVFRRAVHVTARTISTRHSLSPESDIPCVRK